MTRRHRWRLIQSSPPVTYFKDGASREDFARARARCLVQAETAEAASTSPSSWERLATWMSVYNNCMRADGWIGRR